MVGLLSIPSDVLAGMIAVIEALRERMGRRRLEAPYDAAEGVSSAKDGD